MKEDTLCSSHSVYEIFSVWKLDYVWSSMRINNSIFKNI